MKNLKVHFVCSVASIHDLIRDSDQLSALPPPLSLQDPACSTAAVITCNGHFLRTGARLMRTRDSEYLDGGVSREGMEQSQGRSNAVDISGHSPSHH